MAKNNQLIAEQNAKYASAAGEAQASATGLKAANAAGRTKAAIAANGVDVNTGSAVDVQESQREQGQLDTETVLNNAELQAYGYRTQATNYGAESTLKGYEAKTAPIAADIGAVGSALSNASALGYKWSTLGTKPPGSTGPLSLNASDY